MGVALSGVTSALATGSGNRAETGSTGVWVPRGETRCDFNAILTSASGGGAVLRMHPAAGAPVVTRIPPVVTVAGAGAQVPYFHVRGSRNGWFLVRSLGDYDAYLDGAPARPGRIVQGWIEGAHLAVNLQSVRGFARPDPAAAVTTNLDLIQASRSAASIGAASGPDATGAGLPASTVLEACQGDWALIRHGFGNPDVSEPRASDATQTSRGWFRGLCSIFETTCDGLVAD